jgi:membrane-associated phospholipid phosphatase
MPGFKVQKFIPIISFLVFIIQISQDTFAGAGTDSIPGMSDQKTRYFRPSAIIVPSALLAYGWLKPVIPAIENLDNQIMENVRTNHPDFNTKVDDYLQWVPSASIYAMDAFKVKTKHTFIEHLAIDAGSIIITGGAGFIMRKISGNMEVYNSTGSRFPSGHTANAFRGAEIVFQELKDRHRVLSYSGYLVASAVGILRIYNKEHYLTEVLAGAGLGILSTKLTYLAFDKVKAHKKRKSIAP